MPPSIRCDIDEGLCPRKVSLAGGVIRAFEFPCKRIVL
jgi:hypothetical protein